MDACPLPPMEGEWEWINHPIIQNSEWKASETKGASNAYGLVSLIVVCTQAVVYYGQEMMACMQSVQYVS